MMIILLALLDDVPIMTIAYDNTPASQGAGALAHAAAVVRFQFHGSDGGGTEFRSVADRHGMAEQHRVAGLDQADPDQIQTAIFLQIVAGGHLLLFVMRSRGSTFSRPWPAMPLFAAIVGTQIFAVLMCGFGWFVTALPWTIILLVWIYMLVWMAILDGVKLALYSRLREGAERPKWYARFLKGRHPALAAGQAGSAAE